VRAGGPRRSRHVETVVAGAVRGVRAGRRGRNDVTDREDRRTNHALRRRIDQLLRRVRAAQEEIVERGLDAVQETKDLDGDADARRSPRKPDDAAA
jgi:hypothetical protein